MSEEAPEAAALPAETAIGRVSIRVDDLERVVPFYREAIGCQVERDGRTARLSADDGRELLTFEEPPGAPGRPRSAAGLFHVAIRLSDRASLADALDRLRDAGATLSGASDHLVSEALYLTDPAGNGLELYHDRPRESWTRLDGGRVEMDTLSLDVDDLAAAGDGTAREALPAGTDVGHVHLEVTDLGASGDFYGDGIGFATTSQYVRGARFLAAGGYHHHVGLNVWNRRSESVGDHQGLSRFEVVLPDADSRRVVLERLETRGHEVDRNDDVPWAADPDGIRVAFPVRASRDED
ncbi:MAG TPA: VOC family protein [Halobacteriales archaeon]|nr:VOC family protein [Halobacteriales archaeon]